MKNNLKIGIFSLAYEPFVGGAEIAVKEIIKRLPNFDFQIFTHDFRKYGHSKIAKIFYIFKAWWAAERFHKNEPFAAIWAIMAAYGGIAALLFKLHHPKVPFLLTLQEGDSEEHILRRVGIFYFLWKKIFKKADFIQTISHYLADFAKRHGARAPIEVVPNGVNIERNKKQETRDKDNGKIIITTSRLVYKNGIDILIKAISKIPEAKLLILGSGPEEENLRNLTRNLMIENRIEFLGHVEPNHISEYLRGADIFVRPSRSEGLGNSFLEAMAVGLPIIGTPIGGIPDFLKDGETGLFCEVDNAEDLADKIRKVLNDKVLSEKLSRNGRKLVEEKYSWDLIAGKMGEIFKKCTS